MSGNNESRHTEGLWGYSGAEIVSRVTTANGRLLYVRVCAVDTGNTNAKSNARLIAKAPELYESLKKLMNIIRVEEVFEDSDLKEAQEILDQLDEASGWL